MGTGGNLPAYSLAMAAERDELFYDSPYGNKHHHRPVRSYSADSLPVIPDLDHAALSVLVPELPAPCGSRRGTVETGHVYCLPESGTGYG